MLVKVIILFLCVIVLIGMVGKFLFPSAGRAAPRVGVAKCRACGRPQVGRGPCACGQGGK